MTKEQAIEILKCFKDNKIQRDKLEIDNRCGGWKIGRIYKSLELNTAIETVLSMLKEKDEQIEEYRKIGLRTYKQQVQTKKSLKGIINNQNKIIDLMADDIHGTQVECNRYFKDKEEVKQYFEDKAKELLNK